MKTKWIIAAVVLAAPFVRAQEKPEQFDAAAVLKSWGTPQWDVPAEQKTFSGLKLGKSDYVVRGPLIDTFRSRRRLDEPRSMGRKILGLPIINMFVPEPWPKPTRQGKYFAWGERGVPWTVMAERRGSGPQGVLLSVSK